MASQAGADRDTTQRLYPDLSSVSKSGSLQPLDLILIGKSGNGKSALGNSILGRKAFQINNKPSSIITPQKLRKERVDYQGQTINVVDGLNLGECTSTDQGDVERDIEYLTSALSLCNNGFSALLIVIKCGVQFSDEEVKTLKLVKAILGDKVFGRFGICVITFGDNYEYFLEEEEFKDFKEWCSQQPAALGHLIEECHNRYVIFNNRTKDAKEKTEQLDNLFQTIARLSKNGKRRYSEKDFEIARKQRDALLRTRKPQDVERKTTMIVEDARERLKEIEKAGETQDKVVNMERLATEVSRSDEDQIFSGYFHQDHVNFVDEIHGGRQGASHIGEPATTSLLGERAEQFSGEHSMSITFKDGFPKEKIPSCFSSVDDTFGKAKKEHGTLGRARKHQDEEKETTMIVKESREHQLKGPQVDDGSANRNQRAYDDRGDRSRKARAVKRVAEKAMHNPKDIDLLLIGKTGNGKSATGNAILRRKIFQSKSSVSSVTKEVQYEVSDFNGRVIKVVDGPGVGDTRLTNKKSVDLVMKAMEYAIACNPRGYHAFLLVVRFGGRFTEEDRDTIAFLKKIFGNDFVRNFCILVFTCGDNFENDSEETGQTFQDWCKEQEGDFQELLRECNNRAILFNNTTKDEDKRNQQVSDLITMVDNLRFQGHRYSDANFEKAKDARKRVMIEAKKPMIKEEIMAETSLILQKLQLIQSNENPEEEIEPLDILRKRTHNLLDVLQVKDQGTGTLHDLADTVKSIIKSIDDEMKFCGRVMDAREHIRKQEEENVRRMAEEMRRQREEFETKMQQDKLKEEERSRIHREQEKEIKKAEEERQRQREETERKLQAEMEEERGKQQTQYAELERRYKEAKKENDKGFFKKVVDSFMYPFRAFAKWVSS